MSTDSSGDYEHPPQQTLKSLSSVHIRCRHRIATPLEGLFIFAFKIALDPWSMNCRAFHQNASSASPHIKMAMSSLDAVHKFVLSHT